jgi:hypothetical protein
MSGVRSRLARAIDGDSAATDELVRRLDALESAVRADVDRQEALLRGVTAYLTERLAALERRLAALEARDR